MTASIVSRLGQVNAGGAADALFLKQFAGEILTEFEQLTVFKSRHFVRQIRNGKSAQFPMIGTVTSSVHTPGNFIDGQAVNHAEKVISINGLIVAPVFVDKVDELMNHYDVRGPYAMEMGRELAYEYDKAVAIAFTLGARAASILSGRSGGTRLSHADMATSSTAIKNALFTAAQTLDEKKVGSGDRYGYFRPAHYYLLAQDTSLINKDWNGAGSLAQGTIETMAGITLVKSNHVPSTNLTGLAPSDPLGWAAGNDFTTTIGIVANKWGAGTLQLMDISLESEWEIRRQGTFMVAKMATGHDWLRPECCVELYDTV